MAAQAQTPEIPLPDACCRKEELKSGWSGPEQGFFRDQGSVEVDIVVAAKVLFKIVLSIFVTLYSTPSFTVMLSVRFKLGVK